MGEIKSTLDLAMERTRNLSLSKEEKAQQQKDHFKKLLQGALQRYADGAFSADDLRDRITELQTELKVTDHQLVMKAVLKRIDPNQDNERWLDLLSGLAPTTRDSLQEILLNYREQRAKLLQASEKRLLEQFAQQHGITGSAIVPNPDKDTSYQDSLSVLGHKTQTKIDAISEQTI
jgi:hypothetical protein